MSTTIPVPTPPALPLSAEVRAAYQAVYAKNQIAIEGTTDFDLLTALNASQANIGSLISADDVYRIGQNSAQFQALLKAFNDTNTGLKALQSKIDGVAGKISKLSDVAVVIEKVLSMVPGI